MKTKPILFSTEMVQAILEGRKTQTRRVLKPQPIKENLFWKIEVGKDKISTTIEPNEIMNSPIPLTSPYGDVGDILWVRETVFDYKNFKESPLFSNIKENYIYKADGNFIGCHKWKPSIHMPKDAARIFLRVTNIRVERLLEISEEDARKEGVEHLIPRWKDYTNDKGFCYNAWSSFKTLWIKINGIESYTSNPWVWVIEFERVEKPENFK